MNGFEGTPLPSPAPTQLPTPSPSTVAVLSSVDKVFAGDRITFLLNSYGSLWAVGRANDGQLGDGANAVAAVTVLQRVDDIVKNVVELAASVGDVTYSSFVAITEAGTAYYWPESALFAAGAGADTDDVVELTGFSAPVACAAVGRSNKYSYVCALLTSGAVECVGYNDYAMLGDGTKTSQATPVAVKGLPALADEAGRRRAQLVDEGESLDEGDGWYACCF